jgi:hypothetical protein
VVLKEWLLKGLMWRRLSSGKKHGGVCSWRHTHTKQLISSTFILAMPRNLIMKSKLSYVEWFLKEL